MKKNKFRRNFQYASLCCLYVSLSLSNLLAQEKPKFITITGSSRLFGQYASRQGSNQEIPRNYLRWDLNNTLTLYGIPINIRVFLSTEQSNLRQNINNWSFDFDAIKYLNSKGVKKIKFLTLFPTLQFGTCRPDFSELILKGITLKGVNIEFTPGNFYSAFSYGTSMKAVQRYVPEQSTYKQNLTFGKIGYGNKHGSHFYISVLHALDKKNSIKIDTSFSSRPSENIVVATEVSLVMLKKKLTINGELATSLLTRDIGAAEVKDENIPSFLSHIVRYNISSSVDYAYRIKSLLKLKTTKVSLAINMTGPGFISFGTPYQKRDNQQYYARVTQQLFKKKVTLQLFYRRMNDNIIDWKESTTTSTSYGITGNIRLKKLPYLVFTYSPYLQQNNNENFRTENKASLVSLSSGYAYQMAGLRALTAITFSNHNNSNDIDTITIDNRTRYYSLTESVSFKFPLVISVNAGFNNTKLNNESQDLYRVNLRLTYGKAKKWRNTIGFRFSSQDSERSNTGIFLNSIVNIGKHGELILKAERNVFNSNKSVEKEYKELILSFNLVMKW